MTRKTQKLSAKAPLRLTGSQLLFGWFSIFCLLLIFKNAPLANESIRNGLLLCAQTVIPSLFPFMVLSDLLISSDMGERVISYVSRPSERLFRLPPAALCAMVLGLLCGFPVGARGIANACKSGKLSRRDAERVLPFANMPSPAFVIGVVGTSLWKNVRFGIALYLCMTVCVLLFAFFLPRIKKEKKDTLSFFSFDSSLSRKTGGVKLFTESISSATRGILSVCAYVIFFSALMGALQSIFLRFHTPPSLFSFLSCLFELSQGVNSAAQPHSFTAALLCAFACGWSGFSVHCQVICSCDGLGLSYRGYFINKLLLGVSCALAFGVLIFFFPSLLLPA